MTDMILPMQPDFFLVCHDIMQFETIDSQKPPRLRCVIVRNEKL